VPDDSTSIAEVDDATVTQAADEYHIVVAAEYRGDSTGYGTPPGIPDPKIVASRLASVAPAASIAIVSSRNGDPLPVAFGFTVQSTDWRTVQRIVALVQAFYPTDSINWRFQTAPGLSDCTPSIDAGLRASSAQAVRSAYVAAAQSGRSLRRLVLAASYLPNTNGACENGSHYFQIDSDLAPTLVRPATMSVQVDVRVKLVFRSTTGFQVKL
jgi:hypothetical protein